MKQWIINRNKLLKEIEGLINHFDERKINKAESQLVCQSYIDLINASAIRYALKAMELKAMEEITNVNNKRRSKSI